MKNIVSLLFIITLMLLLQACPPVDCIPLTKEYPVLSDSILQMVPYSDKSNVRFMHSAGQIIEFSCTRKKSLRILNCVECCEQIESEMDYTELVPDYPIQPIIFEIENNEDDMSNILIRFGASLFGISCSQNTEEFVDSITLNATKFYNVFLLSDFGNNSYYGQAFELYADSLYYNAEKGVIKLMLTNDEYYMLYEE